MLFYPFNYLHQRNSQAVSNAAEKLKNRNLPMEQILDEEELMSDLRYPSGSQLVGQYGKYINFFIIYIRLALRKRILSIY